MQCVNAQDREKVSEVQGYICGAIQSLIPRLGPQVIIPFADKLMMLLLQVFQSHPNAVHDGSLLVVGTLAAGDCFILGLQCLGLYQGSLKPSSVDSSPDVDDSPRPGCLDRLSLSPTD